MKQDNVWHLHRRDLVRRAGWIGWWTTTMTASEELPDGRWSCVWTSWRPRLVRPQRGARLGVVMVRIARRRVFAPERLAIVSKWWERTDV